MQLLHSSSASLFSHMQIAGFSCMATICDQEKVKTAFALLALMNFTTILTLFLTNFEAFFVVFSVISNILML